MSLRLLIAVFFVALLSFSVGSIAESSSSSATESSFQSTDSSFLSISSDHSNTRSLEQTTPVSVTDNAEYHPPLVLTTAERRWIQENPIINVANEEDWPPYDFISQGEAAGFSIELTRLVASKVGLQIKFINGYSWEQLYALGKNRAIDIFPAIWYRPERSEFLNFSKPYLDVTQVLVVRGTSSIENLEQIASSVVASVRGYAVTDSLKKYYPSIKILEVSTTEEGLRAVSFGKADAFVGSSAPVRQIIRDMSIPGLKISAKSPLDNQFNGELYFALRNDRPLLKTIWQKGLDSVSLKEMDRLTARWLTPTEHLVPGSELHQDGILNLWTIILVSSLAILFVLSAFYFFRRLAKDNLASSDFGSRQFRVKFVLALSFVTLLIMLLISITLAKNRRLLMASIETNLAVTLQNTVEQLDAWAGDSSSSLTQRKETTEFAANEAFLRILRHGRLGSTGETYAFNAEGRLLSESRFHEQLISLALVNSDLHESKQLYIRNPGVDLTKGNVSSTPRAQQPLTKMAQRIIRQSKDGLGHAHSPLIIDLSSYRDYRGVPVFGAGIWDFTLGIGVITEIDTREALRGYRWLSVGLISTAVVLVLLFGIAMMFALSLGEKAMTSLRRSHEELDQRVRERTQQLRDSESKYKSLFELSEDAILTSHEGKFIDCNKAALTMFGFDSKEELVGRHPVDLAPKFQPDGRDSMVAGLSYFERAVKKGSALLEWTNQRADGSTFPTEVLITFMPLADKNIFHITVRDISERRSLEERQKQLLKQADAANRAKSDFLATMSHEIRTPMNAVIGLGHLIGRTELNATQQDYVNKIQSSAHSLLGIIDDILDFSKIEAGLLKIETLEFALKDLLESTTTLASTLIGNRSLDFAYSVDSDVPERLVGDPFRVRQILTNLITNAIKFTEHGSIMLQVEIEQESVLVSQSEATQVVLRFEVKDTGIGINSEKMADLFNPFTQADTSITRRYGGTGLGLSICKQLTEMMGGKINVISEEGKGSCFYFYLPFGIGRQVQVDETRAAHLSCASVLEDPGLEVQAQLVGKVLVVEDNKINQQVAVETLQNMGLTVSVCDNGLDALESLKLQQPDLILMDIHMPEMDGYETTRMIRQMEGASQLPILAMTANAMAGDAEKSKEAGMNGHITKPVDPDKLFYTLKSWLPHSTLRKKQVPESSDQDFISRLPQELPGLDVLQGVKRVGGNHKLYEKLLREFLNNYGKSDEILKQQLAVGDTKSAHRLVHTLGAVSATIGADNLAEVSMDMEARLRKEIVIDSKLQHVFNRACNQLFRGLSSFFGSELAVPIDPAKK
jgi:PAS domain S-box-containing protein